jgi:NTE family protein
VLPGAADHTRAALDLMVMQPEQAASRVGWLGRHLARTKLGLALGAGGARGYAHVGALQVLEQAGYVVDYVAGTSMGALVAALIALGQNASQIESSMRAAFTPEMVDILFRPTMSGQSAGRQAMTDLWRELTLERSFAELEIPLAMVAVDLNSGQPVVLQDGLLWQALLASTAVPGLYPAVEAGEQRLVDGVILSPVPTHAVRAAGADITIAINILNRKPAAGSVASDAAPGGSRAGKSPRLLEVLTEALDLAQMDTSARQAAEADITITPRLGATSWRDFHLADAIIDAGRTAAAERLAAVSAE